MSLSARLRERYNIKPRSEASRSLASCTTSHTPVNRRATGDRDRRAI